MESPLNGSHKILMFRLKGDADKRAAVKLALQTTHTIKESRKVTTTETKDGTIASAGTLTTTIDIEALASDTDVNDMLHYAQKNGLEVEVWEIDFDKPQTGQTGKYLAQYGSGYMSDWETPAKVGDNTTIKTTLTVNGQLVSGYATVNAEDLATVDNFFRDTVKGAQDAQPLAEYNPKDDATAVAPTNTTPTDGHTTGA